MISDTTAILTVVIIILVMYFIYINEHFSSDVVTMNDAGANTIARPSATLGMNMSGGALAKTPADPAPLELTLQYDDNCRSHPLFSMFEQLSKELEGQPHTERTIFKIVKVDRANTSSALPRIIKQKRPSRTLGGRKGVVAEYRGVPNYGALHDWALDDALLL
jgi:hypothetical protein